MGQAAHETVFFMANHSVIRQMLFTDFEALLEGLSSVPDYEDEDAQAVYSTLDRYGNIEALVFFTIYFDEDGCADASWNLPVEKLAAVSGKGPDLGSGPIRLACRSQCAINWHQNDLWDPDMNPGTNDFLAIKKGIAENRMRLKFDRQADVNDIPVLDAVPVLGAESASVAEVDPEKRLKLARLLKEQRLRIRTLESHKEHSSEEVDREQRIIIHAYKNEIQRLKQNAEQLKLVNEKLQEKLSSRNEQYINLQDKVSGQSQIVDELKDRLKNASSDEKDAIEKQKFQAEIVLLREQLDRRDLDSAYREEREELLRAELDELKETMGSSSNDGANKMFETLQSMEVVYVAYHPGVGHVSMTADDIVRYAKNPMAFVAEKAFVTEEKYLAWLEHFEHPCCLHKDSSGVCGRSVTKASAPSDFDVGTSDRCDLHRKSL